MVEIKLQFKSVEEAITVLGKMAGLGEKKAPQAPAAEAKGVPVIQASAAPSTAADAAPSTQATSKGRKPRADAGQARGPNARTAQSTAGAVPGATAPVIGAASTGVTDTGKAADQAANPISTPSAQPASGPALHTEPAAPSPAPVEADKAQPPGVVPDSGAAAPTIEQCQAALTKVFEAKGLTVSTDLMARFGVKRIKEMLPASYAEFIAKCDKVLNGEAV